MGLEALTQPIIKVNGKPNFFSTSVPLLLLISLSSSIFTYPSVRDWCHLIKCPLFFTILRNTGPMLTQFHQELTGTLLH